MRFKVFGVISGFAVLIGSIVVPGSHSVNQDARDSGTIRMQVADGMPLPPPPRATDATVVADGMPLPPPPPTPKATETVFIADGMPLPPPRLGGTAFVA